MLNLNFATLQFFIHIVFATRLMGTKRREGWWVVWAALFGAGNVRTADATFPSVHTMGILKGAVIFGGIRGWGRVLR